MGQTPADLMQFVTHIRARLHSSGTRQILGITGAPGTGKSTFARSLADALGIKRSVVVPMDGFHLANEIIKGTPLRDRKGAIDTFDVGGYVSLLQRLRARDEPTVYAPSYRRGRGADRRLHRGATRHRLGHHRGQLSSLDCAWLGPHPIPGG